MSSSSHRPIHLTTRRQGPGLMLRGTWVLVASAVAWLSFQDVGVANQLALAVTAVAGLVLMQVCRISGLLRLLFIVIAGFMTLRYLAWRISDTLPAIDSISFVPGLLLFLAELYGIAMYFFGVFVNINPIERKPAPLPEDQSSWPTVDVFVPSYNEEADLLEVTLAAAKQIRYPGDKLRVHLLDDGGSEQKRSDRDPVKAGQAKERHEVLQDLCARLGVSYRTRARNDRAKAGNINAALSQTDGDLILILDADHVPTEDFLENTAGYFLQDPKLFLVQTPHFFVNPDPLERNLRTWDKMPSENEMFYCAGQKGLDFWNAAFFCGSAAVLRRRHLEEIGGIACTSVTEDAETALDLHARGYNSVYVSKPMVAGLCPETFAAFIGQRTRWAQGMLQILMLKNPLFRRGLSLPQRIAYLSNATYWLFPLARTLFLLMPLTYLFFGMKIYNASLDEFLAYALAHLICSLMLTNHLFGKVRWPFVSELYEMAQSLFLTPAILGVFLRPRAPTFNVTAKAETLARRFVSDLATPILIMFALLALGTITGIWRYHAYPLQHENLLIVLGWNTINLIFMGAALGIVYERRQRRQIPRMPRDLTAELQIGSHVAHVAVEDLSVSGARVVLASDESIHGQFGSADAVLRVAPPSGERAEDLHVQIRHAVVDDDRIVLGVKFAPASQAERQRVVQLCYGSSDAWVAFQKSRQGSRTILGGLVFVTSLGLRYGLPALWAILRDTSRGAGPRRVSARAKPLALQIGGEG